MKSHFMRNQTRSSFLTWSLRAKEIWTQGLNQCSRTQEKILSLRALLLLRAEEGVRQETDWLTEMLSRSWLIKLEITTWETIKWGSRTGRACSVRKTHLLRKRPHIDRPAHTRTQSALSISIFETSLKISNNLFLTLNWTRNCQKPDSDWWKTTRGSQQRCTKTSKTHFITTDLQLTPPWLRIVLREYPICGPNLTMQICPLSGYRTFTPTPYRPLLIVSACPSCSLSRILWEKETIAR